jgi:hypothetical protein
LFGEQNNFEEIDRYKQHHVLDVPDKGEINTARKIIKIY